MRVERRGVHPAATYPPRRRVRQFLVAIGYLLGGFTSCTFSASFTGASGPRIVFGTAAVEEAVRRVAEVLDRWGYRSVLTAQTGCTAWSARRC